MSIEEIEAEALTLDPKGPIAERELNEAAQYSELERPGLGSAFLN